MIYLETDEMSRTTLHPLPVHVDPSQQPRACLKMVIVGARRVPDWLWNGIDCGGRVSERYRRAIGEDAQVWRESKEVLLRWNLFAQLFTASSSSNFNLQLGRHEVGPLEFVVDWRAEASHLNDSHRRALVTNQGVCVSRGLLVQDDVDWSTTGGGGKSIFWLVASELHV